MGAILSQKAGGNPVVKFDSGIKPVAGCSSGTNVSCTCSANRACVALQNYEQLPSYLRVAIRDLGFAEPSMKGIY